LEELGKDDPVGPSGPDQLRPETNKRKSWQAAPDLAISAPEIPIVPGKVEAVAPRGGHEKPKEAEQHTSGYDRAMPAYSAFELPWQDRLLVIFEAAKHIGGDHRLQRIDQHDVASWKIGQPVDPLAEFTKTGSKGTGNDGGRDGHPL